MEGKKNFELFEDFELWLEYTAIGVRVVSPKFFSPKFVSPTIFSPKFSSPKYL